MNKKYILIAATGLILGTCIGLFFKPSTPSATEHTEEHDTATSTRWTCSMHPQILQAEPGECPICGMDLIPLKKDDSLSTPRELSMSESSKALADIQTTRIRRADSDRSVEMVGRLMRDETKVKSLTARFPARVDTLIVDSVGIPVSEGQILAEIYSPELLSAQRELLGAYQRDPHGKLANIAREKLKLWDLQTDQIDSLLQDGVANEHFELRAPINGVVVNKHVNEGAYLKTGELLYTIVDLSSLWLVLDAYETDLAALHSGQAVEFYVQAYPGESFHGIVDFIEPEVAQQTRTTPIRVTVANDTYKLKPGMLAEGTVQITTDNTSEQPLIIPSSAVLQTGKRAIVYIAKPNADRPTYEGHEITLGARTGDAYIVIEGLQEGDEVVTNGAFKIDSALQIQAKPSMMNPAKAEVTSMPEIHTAHASKGPAFSRALVEQLLPTYLELQAALANDDKETALLALKNMMRATGHTGNAADLIHVMMAAPDLDTMRRPHFETLSSSIIQVLESNPHLYPENLYIMHCSMVYEDRGADWLQSNKDLRNPYYGAMMLHCGSVKKEISHD